VGGGVLRGGRAGRARLRLDDDLLRERRAFRVRLRLDDVLLRERREVDDALTAERHRLVLDTQVLLIAEPERALAAPAFTRVELAPSHDAAELRRPRRSEPSQRWTLSQTGYGHYHYDILHDYL